MKEVWTFNNFNTFLILEKFLRSTQNTLMIFTGMNAGNF